MNDLYIFYASHINFKLGPDRSVEELIKFSLKTYILYL